MFDCNRLNAPIWEVERKEDAAAAQRGIEVTKRRREIEERRELESIDREYQL